MKALLKTILSFFRKASFHRNPPVTIGRGFNNSRALHTILSCTRQEAMKARTENYRRSVQRILDQVQN